MNQWEFMDKEYKASTIFLYDLEEKMFLILNRNRVGW